MFKLGAVEPPPDEGGIIQLFLPQIELAGDGKIKNKGILRERVRTMN